MLGRVGQHGDVLEADLTLCEGSLRLGQFFELARDLDPLHGRAPRELALPAQPGRQRQRAIGFVLARLIESAHADREGGFQGIDAGFPGLDQTLGQRLAVGLANPGGPFIDGGLELCNRRT